MIEAALEDELYRKLKLLSEKLWERRCEVQDIEEWLTNFDGRHLGSRDAERLHALYLLSSLSFFGLKELRVLLRALYRDLYRYPIIQKIREDLGGTKDRDIVAERFDRELRGTRFIGMGSPAESGTHLLYYFRQENRLHRSLFVNYHELLTTALTDPNVDFRDASLTRVVFVDDLCGSGEQAVRYSSTILRDLRKVAASRNRVLEFQYLVLFGTEEGMQRAERDSDFDVVGAVSRLDGTYRTFSAESRIYRKVPAGIDKEDARRFAHGYGAELRPGSPLGYEGSELLLAFHHNVPDNTLPIFWYDEGTPPWKPVFPRHPKIG